MAPRETYDGAIKRKEAEIADLKDKLTKLERSVEEEKKNRTAAEAARAADRAAFAQSTNLLTDKFQEDRKGYEKRLVDLQTLLKNVENKKDDMFLKPLVAELEQLRKDRKDLTDRLKLLDDKLLQMSQMVASRVQETKTVDPTPRGKILRVHVNNPRKANIDLGRKQGLTPQTTFSVHGWQTNGKPKTRSKANVEVVTVGEETSEVLITSMFNPDPATDDPAGNKKVVDVISRDNTDPIVPGDALINPLWNPNTKTHIAVAGTLDLSGSGTLSMNALAGVLERQNVMIDGYLDPLDGTLRGRGVSRRTDYLILGGKATGREVGAPRDKAGIDKFNEEFDKMVNDAKANGVKVITPRQFTQDTGILLPHPKD
jgi:hypothetical protein